MRKNLNINIDNDLLNYTANCFDYQDKTDYSKLIEQALWYFLKPQLSHIQKQTSTDNKKIQELLVEPIIDINTIEKNYNFELSSVEGKWPGDENIEQLIEILNK